MADTLARLGSLALCLLLSSCILSLTPAYQTKDLVSEPALVGTWKPADEPESWTCAAGPDRGYRVTHTDEKGRTGAYAAHLFTLQGHRFLDLVPAPLPESANALYADHWIPGHTIARVLALRDDRLELAVLDEDWLKRLLAADPRAIRHEIVAGDVLLTARTKDLQRFLLDHLATPGAFRATLALDKH